MIDNALWDEFHHVVNMTSRELSEWLRIESATPEDEELPDRAGTETGQHVLHVLRKRKADLTADDVELIRYVIDQVHAQRRDDLEPVQGDSAWRHALMDIGHDPLRAPARSGGETRAHE